MDAILKQMAISADSKDIGRLSRSMVDILKYEGKTKSDQRRDRVKMFAALRKALREIAAPAQGDGWPRRNVLPPAGSGINMPGADPANIKDPALRRQYEAERVRNSRRILRANETAQAELMLRIVEQMMVACAQTAYGQSEEERSALKADVAPLEDKVEFLAKVGALNAGQK